MARRHDADAAGDPEVLASKAALRDQVWDALQEAGVSRFPGAHGRIPNFVGAEQAAEQLRGTDLWQQAKTLKANPDSPQWPVRQRALEDGKTVFMAVPRLADQNPFFLLDPEQLADSPRAASSIKGAQRNAVTVSIEELETVDLVVTGCVAVTRDGARLGKGGGFSDLEYAIAGEAGLLDADTPVVTTVHALQVVEAGSIPVVEHDLRLDLIVTPDEVIRTSSGRGCSPAVRWDELSADKIGSIPVLQRLQGGAGAGD